jgi:hypothetical protein
MSTVLETIIPTVIPVEAASMLAQSPRARISYFSLVSTILATPFYWSIWLIYTAFIIPLIWLLSWIIAPLAWVLQVIFAAIALPYEIYLRFEVSSLSIHLTSATFFKTFNIMNDLLCSR